MWIGTHCVFKCPNFIYSLAYVGYNHEIDYFSWEKNNIWSILNRQCLLSGGSSLIKSEHLSVKPILNSVCKQWLCLCLNGLFRHSSEIGIGTHRKEYCIQMKKTCHLLDSSTICASGSVSHLQSASRAPTLPPSLHFHGCFCVHG